MALRMIDSFDHYVTAQISRKWFITDGTPAISAGNGRRGTACLRLSTANNAWVGRTFSAQATWIVGFAFRIASWSSTGSANIVSVYDGTSNQVDVRLNHDGTLSVTRNGSVLSSTASGVIAAGATNYIELKVTIGNAGSYELRVNGATVASGSGVDTQTSANASANNIRFGSTVAATAWSNADYDDVYICDGTGSANNDFLGDVRVDAYLPSGNGNSSQFSGSDSNNVDNYLLVDEASPNDDTDYVQSSNVGDHDTYTFPNISHTPASIYGVQINMHAIKTDAGFRSIQSVIRSDGVDTDGTAKALGSSYICFTELSEVDPDTSAAWTAAGFDAAEFGAKVAA